jgi:DUF4097 and DUF4098 domain-containing protein YvlB
MIKSLTTALALSVVALPALADDDCRYREPRQVILQVEEATELHLEAAAGSLEVIGSDGLTEVVVDGVACASHQDYLDGIRLDTRRRDSRLVVEVDLPEVHWSRNRYVRLDLIVRVPSSLMLDIEDGSGEIDVRGVGPTRIRDGSGEIDVDTVYGDLTIEDGSGEIDVRNVRGKVNVEEDGSGGIQIASVEGDVDIEEDGSGSISIRDVTGSVRIDEDGSGSIRAVAVNGDFIVDRDGSGGISFDEIGGRVSVPD